MKNNLISIDNLELAEIKHYLAQAERVEQIPPEDRLGILRGRILGAMFYEPSTRTRLSFESAMHRLGGAVLGFSEMTSTSVTKGESLADTVRTVEQYCDIMVIRHPQEGSARAAANIARIPVINAGDGSNQHPSQTLLDLYTIKKLRGGIKGMRLAVVGDLKYSRTVHSLIRALMKWEDVNFLLVSPESLRLPDYLKLTDRAASHRFEETSRLEEAIHGADIVYMTRIQKERFPDIVEYEKVKDAYRLDAAMLKAAPSYLRVLHPLPRVNEIAPDVDDTPFAAYFQQVGSGLVLRQAILSSLLGVTL